MFRSSTFDKTLEVATSHLLLEPDWPSILQICDTIRQNDVTAKQAFQAVKKKMQSPNPHTAYYALLVLESIVKNCGASIHDEISMKENCEFFSSFIETIPHENCRAKMLELVQTWAYAFRSSDKYQAIKDTMTILKAKGHSFPELKEADAMFAADSAPEWVDGKVCHRCRVEFSFTVRKHHCRNCGQIFCGQCSSKQRPLPKFGYERDVRICEGCYAQLQKPLATKSRSSSSTESDLPAEYLNSSLAQQSQTPPRKTEQELKEEEELQLALALSQSEAEQKSKPAPNYRIFQKSPSPEPSPQPQPAVNPLIIDDTPTDPELAKYLNRSYWEQRKANNIDSPASPSAPSPMPQIFSVNPIKTVPEDAEIDDFAHNMKSQVEIFVNRMKSNSSRGRNIANDSSVQTLFMNITSLHSRLLSYIKDMDDKRMWYEQLQDKLTQVKDSRAALDVLRQEHLEKLRRIAEEQERQRQLQMAHKLEIMRKKKQEYLQYQRQLALQRIQEQEREMQMRQEQQKAQYRISQTAFPFIPGQQNSPSHQMPNFNAGPYGYAPNSPNIQRFGPQGQIVAAPIPMPGMYNSGIPPMPQSQMQSSQMPPTQMAQPQMPPQQIPPSQMMPGMPQPGQNLPNQQGPPQPQPLQQSGQGPHQQPQQKQMNPMQNTNGVPMSTAPTGGHINVIQNQSGMPPQGAYIPNPQNAPMPGMAPMMQGGMPPTGHPGQMPLPGQMPPQPQSTNDPQQYPHPHPTQQQQQQPQQQAMQQMPPPPQQQPQPQQVPQQQQQPQQQPAPSSPPNQTSEEEGNEVQTAELISFD